jgi:hypothetical protein
MIDGRALYNRIFPRIHIRCSSCPLNKHDSFRVETASPFNHLLGNLLFRVVKYYNRLDCFNALTQIDPGNFRSITGCVDSSANENLLVRRRRSEACYGRHRPTYMQESSKFRVGRTGVRLWRTFSLLGLVEWQNPIILTCVVLRNVFNARRAIPEESSSRFRWWSRKAEFDELMLFLPSRLVSATFSEHSLISSELPP